jgi:hypothetical protein
MERPTRNTIEALPAGNLVHAIADDYAAYKHPNVKEADELLMPMLLRVTANDLAVGSSSMVSSISSPNVRLNSLPMPSTRPLPSVRSGRSDCRRAKAGTLRYRHARKVARRSELICNASDHWPTTSNFRPNHR